MIVTATNSKDRLTFDGKNSAKCRANLLVELECVSAFAVSFADPQREVYKFNSLMGSVDKLSGHNL